MKSINEVKSPGRLLIIGVLGLAACQSHVPPFSEAERLANPVVSETATWGKVEDRRSFFGKASKTLEKRINLLRTQFPSLEVGPSIENENGKSFWWEELWLKDFENQFVGNQESIGCLKLLSETLEKTNPQYAHEQNCSALAEKLKSQWSSLVQTSVSRLVNLRPTFSSAYQRSLKQELLHFEEAFRMQYVQK